VRPEAFRVVSENDEGLLAIVDVVEELGADAYVYGTLSNEGPEAAVEQVVAPGTEEPGEETTTESVELIARVDARKPPQRGTKIRFAVDHERIHLFSASTGERVSGF
jgi:multiple sugar transport system ATP-binding protein